MTKANETFFKGFLILLLANSIIWFKSSYSKWASGNFVDTLGGTLGKFASKNPNPWFKSFLENTAIPNSTTFGWLTILGESLAAVGTFSAVIYLLFRKPTKLVVYLLLVSLLTGLFLNIIFWLAAGYTSPATDSVNLLMILTQLVGLIFSFRLLKN